jgi:hypothetical protein
MATKSRSLGKQPTDLHARERLREAQAAEASATNAVYSATDVLHAAINKRDQARAVATVAVDAAEIKLAATRAELVTVSGLDRAAMLLGVSTAALRKAAKAQPKSELKPDTTPEPVHNSSSSQA